MTKYVFDRETGRMVDKATRLPMNDPREDWTPTVPMLVHDIEPYLSPVSGEYIAGKRAKRDDLKKHDCVDADEVSSRTPRKFKNKRFIEKHGFQAHAADGVLD